MTILGQLSWAALLTHVLFCLSLVAVSAGITWAMLHRIRIMDIPNERSSHARPIPRSGGIAIVASFLIGVVAIYLFGDRTPILTRYFQGFLISSLAIAGISIYDDINNKSFLVKLATQAVAAMVVLAAGLVIDEIGIPWLGPVHLGWLAYPISFLWIMGLTNAYNFMDGLDGLAAGQAVIVSFFFMLITLNAGSIFVYITCYTILAGACGFLIFNFPPARIFMGDVGSAFLGFVFATLAIIAARYDHSHTSFFVMPLLVFNFIFDTFFTFVRRLIMGENVTKAHREHLYQLFQRSGFSHQTVSLCHYGMTIVQGIVAICMVNVIGDKRILFFLPVLGLQLAYSYFVLNRAKKAGLLGG
jgi:UDP-GlcNAc:undecaprenyl-phosphate GlcNAc-1-phosphate transferase